MTPDETKHLQQENDDSLSSDDSVPAGAVRRAYFSPDDGLEKKLIELIDHEQASMKIAVFQFTNGQIAHAIKRAQQRGVTIEIVTDSSLSAG